MPSEATEPPPPLSDERLAEIEETLNLAKWSGLMSGADGKCQPLDDLMEAGADLLREVRRLRRKHDESIATMSSAESLLFGISVGNVPAPAACRKAADDLFEAITGTAPARHQEAKP